MGHRIKSLESASRCMVEAAVPYGPTPPREVRIARFLEAQSQLSILSKEVFTDLSRGYAPHYASFVPLAIHATREGLYSLVRNDEMDFNTVCAVSDEIQDLCTLLKGSVDFGIEQGREIVGFLAEVGTANMVLAGISKARLGLSEVVLMGSYGRSEQNSGLPDDVDLMIKPKWYEDSGRKQVQLKSSSVDSGNIYGIPVVTAQDLVGSNTPGAAVNKLLGWSHVGPAQEEETYRIFEESLHLVRKEPGPVVARLVSPVRPIAA